MLVIYHLKNYTENSIPKVILETKIDPKYEKEPFTEPSKQVIVESEHTWIGIWCLRTSWEKTKQSDEVTGSLFLVYINSSLGQLHKNRTGTLR